MKIVDLETIHDVLQQEVDNAYNANKEALRKAHSDTEVIEKEDLRAASDRLSRATSALQAFEDHEWSY